MEIICLVGASVPLPRPVVSARKSRFRIPQIRVATREQKVRSKTVAGIKSLWNIGPELLTTRLQISDCDAAAPALTKPVPNGMLGLAAQARMYNGNFGRKDGRLAVEIQEEGKARGKWETKRWSGLLGRDGR